MIPLLPINLLEGRVVVDGMSKHQGCQREAHDESTLTTIAGTSNKERDPTNNELNSDFLGMDIGTIVIEFLSPPNYHSK